jgi:predicted nucleotidyltransferase
MDVERIPEELKAFADGLAQNEQVEAVALAGSAVGKMADPHSDYDIYIYSQETVDVALRENLLRPHAVKLELHRTFWEDEDALIHKDGLKIEFMYRTHAWTEGEVAAKIDRHEATLGYTTAVLYNIQQSQILFDRSGWFKGLQKRLSQAYPDGLTNSIVRKNLPVLGSIVSSYEEQIHAARRRGDLLSLNHRVAAWLASYFDIVFAVNRRFHPGEKRMLDHVTTLPSLPENLIPDVRLACTKSGDLDYDTGDHLAKVRNRLKAWVQDRTNCLVD